MKLLQTTTTENHLLKIEQHVQKTNRMINAAINSLNEGYNYLWGLPDNELQDVLQTLLNAGKLQALFENHYITATSLNTIQDNTGAGGARAIAVAGREFEIDEFGTLTIVPLPEPIVEEPPIEEPQP